MAVDVSIAEELRSLGIIVKRAQKLSPAGQRWLKDWVNDSLSAAAPNGAVTDEAEKVDPI